MSQRKRDRTHPSTRQYAQRIYIDIGLRVPAHRTGAVALGLCYALRNDSLIPGAV